MKEKRGNERKNEKLKMRKRSKKEERMEEERGKNEGGKKKEGRTLTSGCKDIRIRVCGKDSISLQKTILILD